MINITSDFCPRDSKTSWKSLLPGCVTQMSFSYHVKRFWDSEILEESTILSTLLSSRDWLHQSKSSLVPCLGLFSWVTNTGNDLHPPEETFLPPLTYGGTDLPLYPSTRTMSWYLQKICVHLQCHGYCILTVDHCNSASWWPNQYLAKNSNPCFIDSSVLPTLPPLHLL